jgi:hypothetical protein
MFVNSDFSDLLRLLNARNVEYLVIGGYALIQYVEPRYTKDLNLWINPTPANGEAVFRALAEFGAPLAGLTPADFTEEGYYYQMGVPPVRVDIFMSIPGVDFADAWPRRMITDFGDLPVSFISKEDLMAAKRAAGRAQDLLDVTALEERDTFEG